MPLPRMGNVARFSGRPTTMVPFPSSSHSGCDGDYAGNGWNFAGPSKFLFQRAAQHFCIGGPRNQTFMGESFFLNIAFTNFGNLATVFPFANTTSAKSLPLMRDDDPTFANPSSNGKLWFTRCSARRAKAFFCFHQFQYFPPRF